MIRASTVYLAMLSLAFLLAFGCSSNSRDVAAQNYDNASQQVVVPESKIASIHSLMRLV